MDPLATADDVAHALGLEDADALSEAQTVRVDGLLLRVSRMFRRESDREFTPGTTTVRLLTVAGSVRLTETPSAVTDVEWLDCNGDPVDVEWTLERQEIAIRYADRLLPSGVPITVTYTHTADVPAEVVADVAAIVARHLSVDPDTAQVVSESAGPFSQRYANWVSDTSLLTEEECRVARSYRYPTPSVIIQTP